MSRGTEQTREGDSRGASAAWEDFKLQVMSSTDIVELIGQTVSLKKRGKDYVGLCPFHQEKSPSFHVNPERQFYYCYGCKAGGDAISFVKQRDRTEFIDALKTLATSAGIPLPQGRNRESASDAQRCLEANSSTAMYFEKLLADPKVGRAAREYLTQRGITEETVRKFRIGVAADAWEGLLKSDVGRQFPPEQLQVAGLAKPRDRDKGGGWYDTFRNRLMFPIRDPNGRVIAFGGRVLPGSQDPAKYLNSPETPVFSKGRSLYGLDQARQRIVETRTVVVVEGYTDVVMAHQFGATNVVSPLGTALTEQHVALLRRFAERIVLLFDPDVAGETAVDRAVGLFLTQPVEIAIAALDEDLDPDEYLLKHGLEQFEKLISSAPGALAYKWKQLVRRFGSEGDVTGQQKALEAYLDLIARARQAGPVDPIRWGLTVSQVAKLTGIPGEQLHRQLASAASAIRSRASSPAEATADRPVSRSSVVQRERLEPARRRGVLSARDRAERWILGTLLLQPDKWHTVQTLLAPEDFTEPGRRRLAEVYWGYQSDEGEPTFGEFLALLGDASPLEHGSAGRSSAIDIADGADFGGSSRSEGGPASDDDGPDGVSQATLRELAVDVTQEVESMSGGESERETALGSAIVHLQQSRQNREKSQLIASLRRSNEQALQPGQEVDLLRQLQEQLKRTQTPPKSPDGRGK